MNATAEAAATYLRKTGNDDLLPILGLDDPEPPAPTVDGRAYCPACNQLLPVDGRKACRRASCTTGPKARGVKR